VIVIDTSSLAKYLLHEENWSTIENYLVKGVYSVDHIVKEVTNAIWKHIVIRKLVTTDLGLKVFQQLKRLIDEGVIKLEPQIIYLDKAMEIAIRYSIPLYDSLYIAQALKYRELLTSDKTQADVAKALGITVHLIE